MGRKDIKFEYYRVYAREYDQKNNSSNEERLLCDISPLLEKASKIDISNREYEVNGEISRLQEIKQDELEPNIWLMNFLRMRDVVPGIAKRNTSDYNLISLEDDEYVGEEITVLYDKNFKIIMIQRNKNSLSPTGLEKYFTGVADNGMLIEFLPIPMPDKMKEIPNSAIIKKASVSFCPTKLDNELLEELSDGWKAIMQGTKQLRGYKCNNNDFCRKL